MSREWIESHLRRLEPQERRLLFKRAAHYAQGLGDRVLGETPRYTQTGADIVSMALARMSDGCEGYALRGGDILFYYSLCRCCRMAALSLQIGPDQDEASAMPRAHSPQVDDDDTPLELTETAALAFLQRRNGLDEFLALIKDKKLKGKQRAYSQGLPKYGLEGWDAERIAKDLRVTPDTVREYRSRLRAFLEEFELRRERRR